MSGLDCQPKENSPDEIQSSTQEDGITSHARYRPNLQHQHLEELESCQCRVKCEFCDAEVLERDLPSHLKDNMVPHMSLLARDNRELKQQLEKLQNAA